ncbi:hypothetical protein J5N97_023175 [Dioscorea zingiberensis]|uniref:Replication factor A C-terminal domain-containing protein n=1 Tax=Dioscorea zingiberensis TaxID=325984 RepID=A0A9D5CCI2_9LILI|nr:hypothetical protein J5N97_023175 [Dioscorea zingiberensis]
MAALKQPWTTLCTIMAADTSNLTYRVCSLCDRTLPDSPSDSPCPSCIHRTSSPGSHRRFRLLLSIATTDRALIVVCFDRAARVLFGCSADEFLQLDPSSALKVGQMMVGEICRITLKPPTNGNAQHLRVVSIEPLRSEFLPVITRLRTISETGTS